MIMMSHSINWQSGKVSDKKLEIWYVAKRCGEKNSDQKIGKLENWKKGYYGKIWAEDFQKNERKSFQQNRALARQFFWKDYSFIFFEIFWPKFFSCNFFQLITSPIFLSPTLHDTVERVNMRQTEVLTCTIQRSIFRSTHMMADQLMGPTRTRWCGLSKTAYGSAAVGVRYVSLGGGVQP